jgi:very-short-patch-repair endonuclease
MTNHNAVDLRQNATAAERKLWPALRRRQFNGYKFRRQHPIGSCIADFACTKFRLVIEADGGQHAENERDKRRTRYLEARGWNVLRFWNSDILANIEGVLEVILNTLVLDKPSPGNHTP